MKAECVCLWLDEIPKDCTKHPLGFIEELGITYKHWEPIVVCALIKLHDCEIPDNAKLPGWISIQY